MVTIIDVLASFRNHLYRFRAEKVMASRSAIGKAIYYLVGCFNYLVRILRDGWLEIDDYSVKNAIRPIALGRKNYLFAGSHEGAKNAAII